VLGGLITSTLYALCVVPALYAWFGASILTREVFDDVVIDTAPVMGEALALAPARYETTPGVGH